MPKDKKKAVTRNNRWIARHLAEGLCDKCSLPALPGKRKCEKHQKAFQEYQDNYNKTRRKELPSQSNAQQKLNKAMRAISS